MCFLVLLRNCAGQNEISLYDLLCKKGYNTAIFQIAPALVQFEIPIIKKLT